MKFIRRKGVVRPPKGSREDALRNKWLKDGRPFGRPKRGPIQEAILKYENTTFDRWWREHKNPIFVARHQAFEPVLLAKKEVYVDGLETLLGRKIHPEELQDGGNPQKHSDLQVEVARTLREHNDRMIQVMVEQNMKKPIKMHRPLFPQEWQEKLESPGPSENIYPLRRTIADDGSSSSKMKRKSEDYELNEIREYKKQNKNNPWWKSPNPLHYGLNMMGLFTSTFGYHPMIQKGNFDLMNTGVSLILGREVESYEFSTDHNGIKEEVRERVQRWDRKWYDILSRRREETSPKNYR